MDTILCDGVKRPWYKWRLRYKYYFLYVSSNNMNEVVSIHNQIMQQNMQDLQNRFDAATCEKPECTKRRGRYKTHRNYRRSTRLALTLGLVVRYKIFDNTKVNVWCSR